MSGRDRKRERGSKPPQGGPERHRNPGNTSEIPIRPARSLGQGQSRSPDSEGYTSTERRTQGESRSPSNRSSPPRSEGHSSRERRIRGESRSPSNASIPPNPPVIFLDAKSLTKGSLPEIEYLEKRHTTSSAVHSHLRFRGNLQDWPYFELEVRQVFNQTFEKWDSARSNILSVQLRNPPANSIDLEQYLCGEELSSSGRYVQHVLHVMTAVGKELGLNLQFGDWYTSYVHEKKSSTTPATAGTISTGGGSAQREGRKIPDYALMAEGKNNHTDSFARALGEAKSPYKKVHNFAGWVDNARRRDDAQLRKLLGQVSAYMWEFNLKYAFVTNYTTTIFLKQDLNNNRVPTLFYSPGIQSTVNSDPSQSQGRTRNATLPQVSVRECMLFLQNAVQGDKWKSTMKYDRKDWVEDLETVNEPSKTAGAIPSSRTPLSTKESSYGVARRGDNTSSQQPTKETSRSTSERRSPQREDKGKGKEPQRHQPRGPRPPQK